MKTYSFGKWVVYITVIFSAVITLTSCQKHKDNSLIGLTGSWVESSTKTDTIFFNSDKETGMVSLHRGFEIRNGYRLPVIGSDIYSYEILTDSIRLMGGLSAIFFDETFYFKYDEANQTINIGKFSQYIETNESILTFRKIK